MIIQAACSKDETTSDLKSFSDEWQRMQKAEEGSEDEKKILETIKNHPKATKMCRDPPLLWPNGQVVHFMHREDNAANKRETSNSSGLGLTVKCNKVVMLLVFSMAAAFILGFALGRATAPVTPKMMLARGA